jgi:hypothetical protein
MKSLSFFPLFFSLPTLPLSLSLSGMIIEVAGVCAAEETYRVHNCVTRDVTVTACSVAYT